jgi:hypothetical protein
MDQWRGKVKLSGDFKGNRDADIHFQFRFCDDGIYYYMVEQVGIWRLAHRGRFAIGTAGSFRWGQSDRRVIRLEPFVLDIDPQSADAYDMLKERGLPAGHAEDYYLSVWQTDHAVNPAIKLRYYSFAIPGADIYSSRDWQIQPANQ